MTNISTAAREKLHESNAKPRMVSREDGLQIWTDGPDLSPKPIFGLLTVKKLHGWRVALSYLRFRLSK